MIYSWAIVGAGPAGIAAVGKLLDEGIAPKDILWIDPDFQVGDLGRFWHQVGSNTSVKLFQAFLQAARSFSYHKAPKDFLLNHLPENETCKLQHVVEPLQWVTRHLCQTVSTKIAMVQQLDLHNNLWHIHSDSNLYQAKQVILATGADAKTLPYAHPPVIPLTDAVNKERLSQLVNPDACYAVFGSSHSAIIILNYLVELNVKKIINFYHSPCRYALSMGDWTLFDNTGLKGHAAQWARQYIDGKQPEHLLRYMSNEANVNRLLPQCDKVIYAIGFKSRNNISIGDAEHHPYNPHNGIIAPGLFGVGIGYPEIKADPLGYIESYVGLWKFMVYLNKVLPIWLNYHA